MNIKKEKKLKFNGEILMIALTGIIVYILASKYDILELIIKYVHAHESYELDELIPVAVYLMFAFLVVSIRRTINLRRAHREIKQLRGIIPICSVCHKIRDEEGLWQRLEMYLNQHTNAEFSHGICSECAEKMYGKDFTEKEIKTESEP